MDIKTELAWSCRILYMLGMNDITLGHITVHDRATGEIHMKPQGLGFDEVRPADIVTIDINGNKIGGADHKVHREWPIHTEIFKARPEVNCVIHVHPIHATALACVDNPLELLAHDSILFHAGVGLFEGAPDLIMRPEEGAAVAAALGNCKAVLMRNHGVTCVGENIPAAIAAAAMLDRAAEFQAIARSLGKTLTLTPEGAARAAELARGSQRQNKEFFDYFIRKARRSGLGEGMPA